AASGRWGDVELQESRQAARCRLQRFLRPGTFVLYKQFTMCSFLISLFSSFFPFPPLSAPNGTVQFILPFPAGQSDDWPGQPVSARPLAQAKRRPGGAVAARGGG